MRTIRSLLALSTTAILLSACGGGGSSNNTSALGSSNTTDNALASLMGTYVVACTGQDFGNNNSESEQGTITITPASGSYDATASMHVQYYLGSTDCTPSTLDTDLTVNGYINAKGTTKNYMGANAQTVTAKVATLTYSGLTLSKGNLTGITIPMFGATADVAYVLDGNKLYASKGHIQADGLGDSLSKEAAVKQ